MPFAAIFLHSFYILVSYLREDVVPWPHPCRSLVQIKHRFKVKTFLLEIAMFLGRKIDKIETDLKLQIFSFIIRSSVVRLSVV